MDGYDGLLAIHLVVTYVAVDPVLQIYPLDGQPRVLGWCLGGEGDFEGGEVSLGKGLDYSLFGGDF